MEENKVEKNKRKYLTVGIITTIIMLALGITLAVTDWTKLFVISGTSGCFTINYTKGQDVTSGIEVGTSYSDKGVSSDIVMYKDPTCKVDALGTLYITTNDTSSIDFTTGALKYSVVVDNIEVSSGSVSGETNQVIYNFYLNDTPTTYKVYLWLDINLYQEREGDTYSGFVHAEAIQVTQKSEPNSPELVQGLIPVTYNETTKQWVKADTTNTGNNWYNYLNKKWANAVLVSETGYAATDKIVNISNNTNNGVYISSNTESRYTTATSTFIITTGSTAGTLSFDYSVSSNTSLNTLTVTVNGTTIANGISGEVSDTYSVSAPANTTYTIVATYRRPSSATGMNRAIISNIVMPTGSTISVTNGDNYYFKEYHNIIGNSFTYSNSNNKFQLTDIEDLSISSSLVGKYICPDITQTQCTTMYKITGASDKITKVKEIDGTKEEKRTKYSNADVGTEISDLDILAFYVWIPRYKYRVWNINKVGSSSNYSYNAYEKGVDIVFENDTASTGTINCEYSYAALSSTAGSPNETCTGSNGQYYTHPAFTFGDDELKGFWIGKFELSSSNQSADSGGGSSTTLTAKILPNVNSWKNNSLSNFFTVIQNMQIDSNIYGLSTDKTNTDSHMIKNMEWGAVAYLTNSNFGRCTGGICTEVTINNCWNDNGIKIITGIGADTVSADYSSTTCTTDTNKYNGEKGVLASTTGNVYGVYDMSGGSGEFTMGNMSSASGSYTFNSGGSGFDATWYDDVNNQKYLDTYAYNATHYNSGGNSRGNMSKLGDALGEAFWYNDNKIFPYQSTSIWFKRGERGLIGTSAGIFASNSDKGYSDWQTSTRAILSPLT